MKKTLLFLIGIMMVSWAVAEPAERQKVVMEIFTGTWCGFCPGAAMGAEDMLDNGHDVAIIKFHVGDSYANAHSNARANYYNPQGYPTTWFDGTLSHAGGNPNNSIYPTFLNLYNQRIDVPSPFTLEMEVEHTDGDDYDLTVWVTHVSDFSAADLRLHVAVTETDIPHNWFNQNYVKDVMRTMVPDQNGTSLDFNGKETQEIELSFSLQSAWVAENMSVVAFVQDHTSKEIFQGEVIRLHEEDDDNGDDDNGDDDNGDDDNGDEDNFHAPHDLHVITEDMEDGEALFTWHLDADDDDNGDDADTHEFRYDDGVVDAQLGFQGTWNSVMGAAHHHDAVLEEMTWYLTNEGGPHSTVKVWVLGLDANGLPDRNNTLYIAEDIPNTDDEWNSYTFTEAIEAPDGFFIGLSYNGFLGLAVDNGIGEPWDFVPDTQFGIFDITDTTNEFTCISNWDFEVNYLIRAYGENLGELKADPAATRTATGPAPQLIPLDSPIYAGDPTPGGQRNKTLTGFNVFLNDEEIDNGVQDMEYHFTDLYEGDHSAGVQAVYANGESEIVTVDFSITYDEDDDDVSVTDAEVPAIRIYPNPAQDYLFVEGDQNMQSVRIIDMLGQEVYHRHAGDQQLSIDVSNLNTGLYFIQVATEKGVKSYRVQITR